MRHRALSACTTIAADRTASAKLTTWYSIGQIAGPALVAAALSETMTGAFIAAAIALIFGMVLTLVGAVSGNLRH